MRSLYECSHARVNHGRICCHKGHSLLVQSSDGGVDMRRLARGEPLVFANCQKCPDFESIGEPVPEDERGWVKTAGEKR